MQDDLQLETMRIYRSLVGLREDWGGKLALCCGPGCAHSGASTAVSIAGGTTLALDSDAAAMKSAMRAGYLDFVVNTLDEALRTLKNEIRQKRPLSVGLIANVEATLAEMVERGLQPDLQLGSTEIASQSFCVLRERGMLSLGSIAADTEERFFRTSDAEALRNIDAFLHKTFAADDQVRSRWLERVPKYLREARSGGRWIWLNDAELALLAEAGLIPVPQP